MSSSMRHIFYSVLKKNSVNSNKFISAPSIYSNTYNINEVGDALRNAYQDFNKFEDKTHKYSHIPILKNKKI